jgi:hypothetical protein
MSEDAWKELLIDLVCMDEMLMLQLLTILIDIKRDIRAVNMFLEVFGRQVLSQLSLSTQNFFNKNFNFTSKNSNNSNNQIDSNLYYRANLGDITFVDNRIAFIDMLNYFEKNKSTLDVIGMDCEWKPVFDVEDHLVTDLMSDKRNRPSTFQIATREKCFILETKNFLDTLDDDLINKFGDLILFSSTLLKLGYGFCQDAKRLSCSFPTFKHTFVKFTQDVINLDKVASECQKINPKIFQQIVSANKSGPKGLSKLTMICLGKQLDKRECMSNWDNKPLRKAQLQYAALDALVLINIHDFIQSKCKELNISYDYTKKSIL